jgi:hypothetical protein
MLFSTSALTPSVIKLLELISTFAPIGMRYLGRTLALTPSVKEALNSDWGCHGNAPKDYIKRKAANKSINSKP